MTIEDRINKIQRLSFAWTEKWIYKWVSSGEISLIEFRKLIDVNRCLIF